MMLPKPDTTPSASRPRSYSGGYMDAGKVGEAIFLEFLRADPDTACVLDVRSDKHWQDCDVDFRVRRGTGEWWSVEGKYDRHLDKTGNVLFELFRGHSRGSMSLAGAFDQQQSICFSTRRQRTRYIRSGCFSIG